MTQLDFFQRVRTPREVVMTFRDAGWNAHGRVALFACPRCGKESGWIHIQREEDMFVGPPCEKCNRERRWEDQQK